MNPGKMVRVIGTCALALAAASAHAGVGVGGVVVLGPEAAAIAAVPTLSEWMLLGLMLLVTVIAYRVLRGKGHGRLLSNLVLVGGAALCVATGHDVAGRAWAAAFPNYDITNPAGGSASVAGNTESSVTNATTVPMKVLSVTFNDPYLARTPSGSPKCAAGLSVAPGQKCWIHPYYGE